MVDGGGGEPDRKPEEMDALMLWVVGMPGVGELTDPAEPFDPRLPDDPIVFKPPFPSITAFPSAFASTDPD